MESNGGNVTRTVRSRQLEETRKARRLSKIPPIAKGTFIMIPTPVLCRMTTFSTAVYQCKGKSVDDSTKKRMNV